MLAQKTQISRVSGRCLSLKAYPIHFPLANDDNSCDSHRLPIWVGMGLRQPTCVVDMVVVAGLGGFACFYMT